MSKPSITLTPSQEEYNLLLEESKTNEYPSLKAYVQHIVSNRHATQDSTPPTPPPPPIPVVPGTASDSELLKEIEVLKKQKDYLYHKALSGFVSRSTIDKKLFQIQNSK